MYIIIYTLYWLNFQARVSVLYNIILVYWISKRNIANSLQVSIFISFWYVNIDMTSHSMTLYAITIIRFLCYFCYFWGASEVQLELLWLQNAGDANIVGYCVGYVEGDSSSQSISCKIVKSIICKPIVSQTKSTLIHMIWNFILMSLYCFY